MAVVFLFFEITLCSDSSDKTCNNEVKDADDMSNKIENMH